MSGLRPAVLCHTTLCCGGQTVDAWWSSPGVCAIPGIPGTFPANYNPYDVCGGMEGVGQMPLQDDAGLQYGTLTAFRNFSNALYLTVTLDGNDQGQYLYTPPAGVRGGGQQGGLGWVLGCLGACVLGGRGRGAGVHRF